MYISNQKLSKILSEGGYIDLNSNDIMDWSETDKTAFISDYLHACCDDGRADINAEAASEVDIRKFYTNREEFMNDLDKSIYKNLELLVRDEIIQEINAINLNQELEDKGFYETVLRLDNYQFSQIH